MLNPVCIELDYFKYSTIIIQINFRNEQLISLLYFNLCKVTIKSIDYVYFIHYEKNNPQSCK